MNHVKIFWQTTQRMILFQSIINIPFPREKYFLPCLRWKWVTVWQNFTSFLRLRSINHCEITLFLALESQRCWIREWCSDFCAQEARKQRSKAVVIDFLFRRRQPMYFGCKLCLNGSCTERSIPKGLVLRGWNLKEVESSVGILGN
jgi:hypothetical protein